MPLRVTPCTPAQLVAQPGYHLVVIEKGELGELSKVREELEELLDAQAQGSKIMMAVEAADLVGALKAFLARHLPGTTLADLETFSNITSRAFTSGRRGGGANQELDCPAPSPRPTSPPTPRP